MLVVCGGYEGVLLGLETELNNSSKHKDQFDLNGSKESSDHSEGHLDSVTQVFKLISCQGSIKCMSLCNNTLVCGGSDETVQVYNLDKKVKHGEIMLPEGFITSVCVFGGLNKGFVLIGNEHGDISMYSTRDLSFSRSFKGHNKEITGLSVHFEGKTFISTSADSYLRLWDLVSKTCVFNTKLNFVPITAQWSTGHKYLLGSENEVLVCSSEDDKFNSIRVENRDKVTSCCWFGEFVVLGFKSGVISVYKESLLSSSKLHNKRVKSVTSKQGHIFSGDSEGTVLCLRLQNNKLEVVWKHEIEFRLNVLVT